MFAKRDMSDYFYAFMITSNNQDEKTLPFVSLKFIKI